ncbi:uncharacterized protein LOC117664969 [Pantherophis guttatus]|uniref:ribonuclease H n=1 Tax=Pantherophis guttatus TaxID=94885 RepID=A0A6P9BN79_PANGU|nr:uncharacterized protein LOC117664969 [Pantherophis guttatus]
MQSLQTILEGIRIGDLLTSIDLTEAYLHVPIHPSHRHFLRVCFANSHYQYRALPFGLSSAPRVFTKLMSALAAHLRTLPIRMQFYLDDLLIQSTSVERAHHDLDTTLWVLRSHGFSVNLAKSHLMPSTRIQHLGAIIDLKESRVYLSQDCLSSLRSLVRSVMAGKGSSLASLSQLLGKMVSCIGIVPWAHLHCRQLQWFLLPYQKRQLGTSLRIVRLPPKVLRSLQWWNSEALLRGREFRESHHLVLATDASLHGWGVHLTSSFTQGRWTRSDLAHNINWLELRAIHLALRVFTHKVQDRHVLVRIDNVAAKAHMNRLGGTRSQYLMEEARETGELGRGSSEVLESITHFGSSEHPGGLAQPSHRGSRGMGPGSGSIHRDHVAVRDSGGGPVRHSGQSSGEEILLQVSGTRSGRRRYSTQRLASRTPVHLSAPSSDSQGHPEDAAGEGGTAPDCSPLASSSLVRGPEGSVHSPSMASSSGQTHSAPGISPPSRCRVATTHRLEIERRLLSDWKLPPRVIATIQAAHRPSTTRIYDSTWRNFSSWCQRNSITSTKASTEQVLIFLQERLDAGLAPNTLRRQVAAISSILCCGPRVSLSSRPLIRQFLRGASNICPAPIHRYPTWDLPKVLDALTRAPFELLREVGLHFLSYKMTFLLAITSAKQVSELAALSMRADLCIFHPDRVVLRLDPTFLPKVNSPFHRSLEIILPDFCPNPSHPSERVWHTVDVRRALLIYLKRTSTIRQSESLLVSFQPASLGRKVSLPVLGRWIRATIAKAYKTQSLPVPHRITAHSIHSAATSVAWATQASIEEVCRAAAWASPTPFIRHYRLDRFASADAAFGRRVLQQVLRGQASPPRQGPSL